MPTRVEGNIDLAVAISTGRVTMAGLLTVDVGGFGYNLGGVYKEFVGAAGQAVTPSEVNYVYVDDANELQANTTGYPAGEHIRLARVVADASVITAIVDDRAFLSCTAEDGSADIYKLDPYQVTDDYAPTYAQLMSNGPVIIVDSTAGDVTVTLPAADTAPADSKIHRAWVHHLGGGNLCQVEVAGSENFFDGLVELHLPVGKTAQLGVMNMGDDAPGWLRISDIDTVCAARRQATWAAANFSSWTSIPFDQQTAEDNPHVIEWAPGQPTRITAKLTARYWVQYVCSLDSTGGGGAWSILSRILLNGSDIPQPGKLRSGNYSNEDASISHPGFPLDLNAGDYIELQLNHNGLVGNMNSALLSVRIEV